MSEGTYNIYKEELEELSYQPTGFFDSIVNKISRKLSSTIDIQYSFDVPVSDFLRGELFCEDVAEVLNVEFTQRDLISILIDDFLYEAKKNYNPYHMYNQLDIRSDHTLYIFRYEGTKKIYNQNVSNQKKKKFICTIRRKVALRLEVILSDITDLGRDRTFTVSDVLRIVYCDFIKNYKSGQRTDYMNHLVKKLSKNA